MRKRFIKKGTRVLTATATNVVTFKRPSDFAEGKIKAYLTELGMDVREYELKAKIRLENALLNKGLITI